MKKLTLAFIYSVMISQCAYGADLADGYYNEYFLGMKSGGPWAHSELKSQITNMLKDDSLSVLCVIGPDNTVSSYVEVEQYRKTHAKVELTSTCNGGGWVYVGPYVDIESAKGSRIYYTGAMLHTIDGETLLCKSSACVVVKR